MKTYEITQVVEMMVTHRVRARDAAEANDIATTRTERACRALSHVRKGIGFGDITDDYIPARDDDDAPREALLADRRR